MSAALHYPLEHEPQTGNGSAVEVAPGVLWLRMPLFVALPWINVWALADEQSWTLVDSGIHSPNTIQAWQSAFAGCLDNRPVTRVLATHMHPDHCGMAGWLVDRFKARLWMTRLEYFTCRTMTADTGRPAPPPAIEFYLSAGWDEPAIQRYQQKFGSFGEYIYPLPDSFRRIVEGEVLKIGAHDWTVVVGSGHSPEHACLHCPDLKLFIAGDQVLPKISSNVSVYPTEPDANPLADWLNSLAAIEARIPDDVLVLPAHNSPFTGLHARTQQLIRSHHEGLARLEALLSEPKRVVDVFPALFNRPISPELLGMATGEAIAHLNYLLTTGRAVRHQDDRGVWWWRRVSKLGDAGVPHSAFGE